jgi:hypothetical protein
LEIQLFRLNFWQCGSFFVYFFGGLECVVGHSSAYVAYFVFLRDLWIRTQEDTVQQAGASLTWPTKVAREFFLFFTSQEE